MALFRRGLFPRARTQANKFQDVQNLRRFRGFRSSSTCFVSIFKEGNLSKAFAQQVGRWLLLGLVISSLAGVAAFAQETTAGIEGRVTDPVEVTSAAPLVDVTQSKVQTNVDRDQIANIPKGRSFQSLIPFAPGARQEPMQGGTSSRTNGFQIDGASDSENVYLIDGINTTNIQNGGVGKSFQMEFIEEVQIKSSSFEAEYG